MHPSIFLGGCCSSTTWRADIAVPILRKHGIDFFNPQTDDWSPDMLEEETRAKQNCSILLLVVDSKSRAIHTMLECMEFILQQRTVVLVVNECRGTAEGEKVSGRELEDLNRARLFLQSVAKKWSQTCTLCDSIEQAIQHIVLLHSTVINRSTARAAPGTASSKSSSGGSGNNAGSVNRMALSSFESKTPDIGQPKLRARGSAKFGEINSDEAITISKQLSSMGLNQEE
mmetsp:Transcript_690/g.921  ORF Transcript_690/g.921 Transcript_690/m.921 type:complete len:229 (+) Transcript_690:17-703(+)